MYTEMPIGVHVSKTDGSLAHAIAHAHVALREWGLRDPCAQIFVTGPRTARTALDDQEIRDITNFIRETSMPLVIHGAYVDYPWSGLASAIANINRELAIAARIGATGVVVHLGAGASDKSTLVNIFSKLQGKSRIWFEIHSAVPPHTYETPEKITALFTSITDVAREYSLDVGLCIDTAHVFSCGVALDSREVATAWLNGLPDIPTMLHLNDSASVIGSGRDIHAPLCEGAIWSAYHPTSGILPIETSGLVAILEWAETNNIVTILERKRDSIAADVALIRELGFFVAHK